MLRYVTENTCVTDSVTVQTAVVFSCPTRSSLRSCRSRALPATSLPETAIGLVTSSGLSLVCAHTCACYHRACRAAIDRPPVSTLTYRFCFYSRGVEASFEVPMHLSN